MMEYVKIKGFCTIYISKQHFEVFPTGICMLRKLVKAKVHIKLNFNSMEQEPTVFAPPLCIHSVKFNSSLEKKMVYKSRSVARAAWMDR